MKYLQLKKKPGFTKEVRDISTDKIAYKLAHIMKHHIGFDNAITKENLYVQVFNKQYDDDNAADYLRWHFVKKAMHRLRLRSNCFIAFSRKVLQNKQFLTFFVIETMKDASYYHEVLESNIKRMKIMQRKAVTAVLEKWSRQEWVLLDSKGKPKLIS